MKLALPKFNWRSPRFWLAFTAVNIVCSPTVWVLIIGLMTGQAWARETTQTTTTERQTPVTCTRDEAAKLFVCSSTKITAETTTITAPLPKRRPKADSEGA